VAISNESEELMPGKAPQATEVVYVRLPVELKERLRILANARHGGNLSETIRYLVDDYTARQRQAMQVRWSLERRAEESAP
jgi:Flp pilus assembly protein TadB